MSRENVEIIKRVQADGVDMVEMFRGSAEADFAATDLALFEDDCEIEFVAGPRGPVGPAPSVGLHGFADAWREWLEPWDSYYVEVEEFIDVGDEVVSLVRVSARTTRDGVAIEHRPAAVWSVREGKVARVRFYLHRPEALEAAGLGEPAEG